MKWKQTLFGLFLTSMGGYLLDLNTVKFLGLLLVVIGWDMYMQSFPKEPGE